MSLVGDPPGATIASAIEVAAAVKGMGARRAFAYLHRPRSGRAVYGAGARQGAISARL